MVQYFSYEMMVYYVLLCLQIPQKQDFGHKKNCKIKIQEKE